MSSISPDLQSVSSNVDLYQNYPNPFFITTKLPYSVSVRSKVKIEVFNLLGEVVQTLVNEDKNPGSYTVEFNAANLPEGIYYYKINSQGYSKTKRMILLK